MNTIKSVLIVEDDLIQLKLLTWIIKEILENAIVLSSDNGAEALSLALDNKPDLIITDWEMPKFDGPELVKRLKEDPATSKIPVIMCTYKNNDYETLNYAFECGVNDFICKPVDKNQMKARISSIMLLSESFRIINRQKEIIRSEKEKVELLLKKVLPENVANELKKYGIAKPALYTDVCVFISDIVGFTKMSSHIELTVLINELNEIFSFFDAVMKKNSCERIKTVGDAYFAVSGMQYKNGNHVENMVNAANEILDYLNERNRSRKIKWEIRVGIHLGDIVGGIIGADKFLFDIFGETVNITSRLEKKAKPMDIHISEKAFSTLNQYSYNSMNRIFLKGIGNITTYSGIRKTV
ncbi:MAG: hypothetical protein A2W91_18365 [Bacteroidetes bacterium GWF2_38_335]|nr:MAG: hypothetical protein A2W91_18365 [Bacteroidetes bacterium GWF2_38_335]OFY80070.1 MAG: hypothetical protein A2281_12270 [Bacteroidetes bacterium RIFOXYA12_FULL_38_20]HBS88605.1 hypothetical protein [Bacteroidales bacterium]